MSHVPQGNFLEFFALTHPLKSFQQTKAVINDENFNNFHINRIFNHSIKCICIYL